MERERGSFDLVCPDGSMEEKILDFCNRAGYEIEILNPRTKLGKSTDSAIQEVVFQRPLAIPTLVASGRFDIGITGQDMVAESGKKVEVLAKLPISRQTNRPARISLVVSEKSNYGKIADLPPGGKIATEYPNITKGYLKRNNRPDIKVILSSGNTEQQISLFEVDAIVELVETGNSLTANGLIEIEVIMGTQMVVFTNIKVLRSPEKKRAIDCFIASLLGALRACDYVRLEVNVPEKFVSQAAEIIDGLKGATICPLVTSGWFSLTSVVGRENQNRVIADLLALGVTDICRTDIDLLMF